MTFPITPSPSLSVCLSLTRPLAQSLHLFHYSSLVGLQRELLLLHSADQFPRLNARQCAWFGHHFALPWPLAHPFKQQTFYRNRGYLQPGKEYDTATGPIRSPASTSTSTSSLSPLLRSPLLSSGRCSFIDPPNTTVIQCQPTALFIHD